MIDYKTYWDTQTNKKNHKQVFENSRQQYERKQGHDGVGISTMNYGREQG